MSVRARNFRESICYRPTADRVATVIFAGMCSKGFLLVPGYDEISTVDHNVPDGSILISKAILRRRIILIRLSVTSTGKRVSGYYG